jgi:nitrite reductase/ring-hydroxylating ferredoxin subunit
MLTPEENELITRVGPDAPMGRVLRRYWLPLVLSEEVETDGAPLRVRLLGEDLIAFRDTNGDVGLVDAYCPHRRAPMFFGRNEDCGLRCVYHGWKFDKSGACVDMPSEPPDSLFKTKVSIAAYPCRERNGVVWAYLGPAPAPELPAIEWNLVPADQRYATKRVQYSNWVQAVEGGIDPSHSGFLHAPLATGSTDVRDRFYLRQKNPSFALLETDYGLRIGTQREADERHDFWSITHFLMPFYNAFARPNGGPDPCVGGFAWVPMDDHTTMAWCFTWNPTRPLQRSEIEEDDHVRRLGGGVHMRPKVDFLPPTSEPGGAFRPIGRRSNDYLVDREAQRTKRFAGVPGLSLQDVSLQEGMGPICDRSKEHLGTSDTAIIAARRLWLRAARAAGDASVRPLGAGAAESYHVRAVGALHPKGADWTEAAVDWITARPGAVAPGLPAS